MKTDFVITGWMVHT